MNLKMPSYNEEKAVSRKSRLNLGYTNLTNHLFLLNSCIDNKSHTFQVNFSSPGELNNVNEFVTLSRK